MKPTPDRGRDDGAETVAMGIDPGSVKTGYGFVRVLPGGAAEHVASGVIRLDTDVGFEDRLGELFGQLAALIDDFRPGTVAVEDVFMNKGAQSALKLGQARGVAIAAAASRGLAVAAYPPRLVKQAVTGTGAAGKEQVKHMIQILLHLRGLPAEDAADALAVALCHTQRLRPARLAP